MRAKEGARACKVGPQQSRRTTAHPTPVADVVAFAAFLICLAIALGVAWLLIVGLYAAVGS